MKKCHVLHIKLIHGNFDKNFYTPVKLYINPSPGHQELNYIQ